MVCCMVVDCEAAGSHALHMVRRVRVTLFYDSACSWKKFPFHILQRFIIISDSHPQPRLGPPIQDISHGMPMGIVEYVRYTERKQASHVAG